MNSGGIQFSKAYETVFFLFLATENGVHSLGNYCLFPVQLYGQLIDKCGSTLKKEMFLLIVFNF